MTSDLTWLKLKEEPYRAGFRKMIKKKFRLLNGKVQDYDIKDEGQTCCALVLTVDNHVVLVKVFRPGPEKVLMEMPGGFIDQDEKPNEAVVREILEETGYKGFVELVGTCLDDAYSNCIRHIFVIKNAKKVQEPQWEDDEQGEIVIMTMPEFKNHLRSGQLTDVEAGYLALDHLKIL